jgi:hypothetical protein
VPVRICRFGRWGERGGPKGNVRLPLDELERPEQNRAAEPAEHVLPARGHVLGLCVACLEFFTLLGLHRVVVDVQHCCPFLAQKGHDGHLGDSQQALA